MFMKVFLQYLKSTVLFGLLVLLCTQCYTDNDDVIRPASSVDIHDFIWNGMNTYYLYKSDVSDLANDRFNNNDEYFDFLNSYDRPESFFDALQSDVDEFSFIVSDYIRLEQALDGITVSNGMEYKIARYPAPNQSLVFGIVTHVLPNTDAADQGIRRGMVFNKINDIQLNEENYISLLRLESYNLGLASFSGASITSLNESKSLTKRQYLENPIFITEVIESGAVKVGYLMYNGFRDNFENELNSVFGNFKSEGVTELVLDLRYNGGGRVKTAQALCSMITGQFNDEILTIEEGNDDIGTILGRTRRFVNTLSSGASINNLQLTRLYVLTTEDTASASELIINALDPYIDVIQIGTNTTGKFQASITLYDSKNYGRIGANIGHTYAIQPLVLKSLNSVGFTDYFNGFTPEIQIIEDYTNLGILGNSNEPLLKAALDDINGIKLLNPKNIVTPSVDIIGNSSQDELDYQRMYISLSN